MMNQYVIYFQYYILEMAITISNTIMLLRKKNSYGRIKQSYFRPYSIQISYIDGKNKGNAKNRQQYYQSDRW